MILLRLSMSQADLNSHFLAFDQVEVHLLHLSLRQQFVENNNLRHLEVTLLGNYAAIGPKSVRRQPALALWSDEIDTIDKEALVTACRLAILSAHADPIQCRLIIHLFIFLPCFPPAIIHRRVASAVKSMQPVDIASNENAVSVRPIIPIYSFSVVCVRVCACVCVCT